MKIETVSTGFKGVSSERGLEEKIGLLNITKEQVRERCKSLPEWDTEVAGNDTVCILQVDELAVRPGGCLDWKNRHNHMTRSSSISP